MRIETYLGLLENEKTEFSKRTLASSEEGSEFKYGKAIGFYAGLQRAIDLLIQSVAEENDNAKDL